jgi:HEAT repeat protein
VVIGVMGAEAGWTEVLPGLVKVWRSGHMYKHVPHAIMRIVSRVGDPSVPGLAEIVREGVRRRGYTAAWASLAAAKLELKDTVPDVRKVVNSYYRAWQARAIIALGRLGDRESAEAIRSKLSHWDENLRAAAAEALGEMGEKAAAEAIRTAMRAEPFGWVRAVMAESLRKLK